MRRWNRKPSRWCPSPVASPRPVACPSLRPSTRLMTSWSVYAQYAQGIYIPDISSFEQKTPEVAVFPKAETTTNYQVGSVYYADNFTFDGDLYYMGVDNNIVFEAPATCRAVHRSGQRNLRRSTFRHSALSGRRRRKAPMPSTTIFSMAALDGAFRIRQRLLQQRPASNHLTIQDGAALDQRDRPYLQVRRIQAVSDRQAGRPAIFRHRQHPVLQAGRL